MDRPCQIEQPDCLPSESTTARAWYGGDKPAASAVLRAAASEEVETILLYAIEEGLQSGADLALVQGLCDKLCDPDMGRLWTGPQALQHLLTALFDLVPSLLERVRVLEKIGAFTLAPELPAAAKKAQVEAVLANSLSGHTRESLRDLIDQFARIWSPRPGRLLDHIVHHPATAGRVLAGRLNAPAARPLKIVGHTYRGVPSSIVRHLAQSQTAAYEGEGEIHLVAAIRETLDAWEKNALAGSGSGLFSLFDTLLLHELVEIILDEMGELDALSAHLTASAFERCLKGPALHLAAEAFFLEWTLLIPQGSDDESKISLDQVLDRESHSPNEEHSEVADATDEEVADPEMTSDSSERVRKYKLEVKEGTNPCVLAIDDSAMVRFAIGEAAKKLGCQILEATDGVEGIAMAKLNKPDVIVLDIIMGEKGGLETLAELRADPELEETPIIMLTVESNQKIVRQAIRGRANDYLVKPASPKELRERIGKYLD